MTTARHTGRRLLWLLIFAMIFGQMVDIRPAAALDVPPLKARVNDYAHMLSPATRQQLESVLASLENEESTQLAVLTINSLEGENLEQFSLKVVEKWQLGQKGADNGALLLIAKNDRKIRIEVGYGLEGTLTDLICGRIIRDIITPQFRSGNFDQGVINGVSAMVAAVRGEFSAESVHKAKKGLSNETSGFLIFLLFALFNIGRMMRRNRLMAASVGSVISPLIGGLFFGLNWLLLLALIPAGFVASYLASAFVGRTAGSGIRRHGGFGGYSSGGFGGGGFGGGGFGGGGGGFGGGGSSGGW